MSMAATTSSIDGRALSSVSPRPASLQTNPTSCRSAFSVSEVSDRRPASIWSRPGIAVAETPGGVQSCSDVADAVGWHVRPPDWTPDGLNVRGLVRDADVGRAALNDRFWRVLRCRWRRNEWPAFRPLRRAEARTIRHVRRAASRPLGSSDAGSRRGSRLPTTSGVPRYIARS
jgi:hypothetical protein